MRLLFVLALLLPLAAFADGFAYGEKFMALNETDQSAVIRLEPGGATVDMYIAITGIPKGKSITYILPFWHKPEGFSMEEMDSGTYQQRYVLPAHSQLEDMNELASSGPARATYTACIATGTVLAGPIALTLLPVFAQAREIARQGGVFGALHPYAEASTSHARAELFEIGKEDLQTLVAQAGLPAKFAAPLKKYQTRFFAVMHLTGVGGKVTDRKAKPRGVHYHFTHPLTGDSGYQYIYPLGTGAAWPQPINMTQVYITCSPEYELMVDAPIEGDIVRYDELVEFVRVSDRWGAGEAFLPMTANLLNESVHHTSAWQIAYFHSNPKQDIRVLLKRRSRSWPMVFSRWLLKSHAPYAFAIGLLLLSIMLATRFVLYPHWVCAGKPGRFLWHSLQAIMLIFLGVSTLSGAILTFIVFVGAMGELSNYIFNLGFDLAALPLIIMVPVLTFLCFVLWCVLSRKITIPLVKVLLPLLATTVGIYVALSAGFITFVTWACRAAVG